MRVREMAWAAGPGRRAEAASRARQAAAGGDHHLHGRDRASGAGSAGERVRRRGEDPVRRATNPAARQGVAVPPRHRVRHGLRRFVEPVPGRLAGRRGVERPAVPGRDAHPDGEVHRDLRHLLERQHFRVLRSRPGPGSAGRCAWPRPPVSADRRRADDLALRPRGPGLPVPGRDAGVPGGRADRARPASQPGRRGDRHRQDRHRRAGLPQPLPTRTAGEAVTAVRGAPQGDSRAVAAHLPGGAGGRQLRRALRRRQSTGAMEACLRVRAVAAFLWRGQHSGRRLRDRRHRRVPSRRGRDLPGHPGSPANRESCSD